MAQTISTATHVGLRLQSHSQACVTVTGYGAITTPNAYAIYGGVTGGWSLTNYGTLAGSVVGVSLVNGGTVVNGSAAYPEAQISGGWCGVALRGVGELIANYGQIRGLGWNSYGVALLSGGTLVNGDGVAGATIRGGAAGALLQALSSTVLNDGTILGSGPFAEGVVLRAGGTIVNGKNERAASIAGTAFGVAMHATSTVLNFGTISSTAGTGLYGNGSNVVVNGGIGATGASISGASDGVHLIGSGGADSLINFGTVSGYSVCGADLSLNGVVVNGSNNDTSALLIGGVEGLWTQGVASITNYGTIIGTETVVSGLVFPPQTFPIAPHAPWGSYGVNMSTAGYLVNGSNSDLSAYIYGKFIGAQVHGAPGTVENFGTIAGGLVGIYTWVGGTIINGSQLDHTALISGAEMGTWNTYPNGTVINFATILSSAGNGVALGAGGHPNAAGTVVNGSLADTAAEITGGTNGVHTVNGGNLANFGTITGATGYGCQLGSGGVFTNGALRDTVALSTGVIAGAGVRGFYGEGTGTQTLINTIANYGTIAGQQIGAFLSGSGVLTNGAVGDTAALIQGGSAAGLASCGLVSVANYGTIEATAGYGASLVGGAIVANGSPAVEYALIAGTTGVFLGGASGTIMNDGSIIGSSGYGAQLNFGGLVENGAPGAYAALVSGAQKGVFGHAQATTVLNYATIASGGAAVYLQGGGTVTNGSPTDGAAMISGGADGVVGHAQPVFVTNYASIESGGVAVYLQNGGTLTNGRAGGGPALVSGGVGVELLWGSVSNYGTITGYSGGIGSRGGPPVSVSNAGEISGGAGFGISLTGGGEVGNGLAGAIHATVTGAAGGVAMLGAPGTVVNEGTIGASGGGGSGVMISSGGTVVNGDANTSALIYGAVDGVALRGPDGAVDNYARILGGIGPDDAGVYVMAGSISNGAPADQGASIASGGDGADLGHGGTLENYGTIVGVAGNGVYLLAGGGVKNGAIGDYAATIDGGSYGIDAKGACATIANSGTIEGGFGVGLRLGGTVVNGTPGSRAAILSGSVSQAVGIAGGIGVVENYGSITGATTGVYERKGGTVINGLRAALCGGASGIAITGGAGTVANDGVIHGTAAAGIYLDGGGTVRNGSAASPGASILGGFNGIDIISGGAVMNGGRLVGIVGYGIWLQGGGTVVNGSRGDYTALIAGGERGVVGRGLPTTVINDATIRSGGFGIYLQGGGTVTNGAPGGGVALISGALEGVAVKGAGGGVANYGQVVGGTGTAGIGLYLVGGDIINGALKDQGAAISAGGDGADLGHGGSVANYGTIVGVTRDGIYLLAGGGVANGAAGDYAAKIEGGSYGIDAKVASAAIANYGTVEGGIGIGLRLGGSVVNGGPGDRAAVILGSTSQGVGIIGGAGIVENYGSISGATVAVYERRGGIVTDAQHAVLSGGASGIAIAGAPGSVANDGTVYGVAAAGIYLNLGGAVRNGSASNQAASVAGGTDGVDIIGGGAVTNNGHIAGASNYGIWLQGGGSVANGTQPTSGADIYGGESGVRVRGGLGTITNAGTIQGGGQGVYLQGGGSVANGAYLEQGALVSGGASGVVIRGGGAYVANAGLIMGGQYGVYARPGGSIVNGASNITGAVISGGSVGVDMLGNATTIVNYGTITGQVGIALGVGATPGTVVNAGMIIGTGGTAVTFGAGVDQLVLDPGSVIVGRVSGSGNEVLELAAGTGNLTGLGSQYQYSGFRTLLVDASASWTLSGDDAVGTVVDQGALRIASGASLDASGGIDPSSNGVVQLQDDATLEVGAMQGAGTSIDFRGTSDLIVDSAASFGSNLGQANFAGPLLQGFGVGDQIDLSGLRLASVVSMHYQAGGILNILGAAGTVAELQFDPATLGGGSFHYSDDGTGHVLIGLG